MKRKSKSFVIIFSCIILSVIIILILLNFQTVYNKFPLLFYLLYIIFTLPVFFVYGYQLGFKGFIRPYLILAILVGICIFINKQFKKKRFFLASMPIVILIILILTSGFFITQSDFDEFFRDRSADNFKVSGDITFYETEKWQNKHPNEELSYNKYILSELSNPTKSYSQFVSANLTSLYTLMNDHNEIFLRYLTTSPDWIVFENKGNKYAARRWNIENNWKYSLNSNYSEFDIDSPDDSTPEFQTRFIIHLNKRNKIFKEHHTADIHLKNGEKKKFYHKKNYVIHDSKSIIDLKKYIIEIQEQTTKPQRILTQASIDFTENEFKKLLNKPTFGNIKSILAPTAIQHNEQIFELHPRYQGGMYQSEIWINPREPGRIYLKAFDTNTNTRLSKISLKEQTNEWVGWSKNPNEFFYSNTLLTIDEGVNDKYYTARFEIWFIPDSGEKERKLTEKVFKINGWER